MYIKNEIKKIIPDSLFLRLKYRQKMGRSLHLRNPKTFNEKIQWLKIHDHNPEYIKMVDKYEVKKYVAEKIGKQYIIPTYGVWDRFEDIDFDSLPERFVLKCTHDSGGIVICNDKADLNIDEVREKLNNCLQSNYYWYGREWPYKNLKPRIIAEKYMSDKPDKDLIDYKFMCFNGEPQIVLVCSDRFGLVGLHEDFYDINWQHLSISRPDHPNSDNGFTKPLCFDEMLEIAKDLAKDIPFVRIDLYDVKGKPYFSEITFYPLSGWEAFIPDEWDYKLGLCLKLPE